MNRMKRASFRPQQRQGRQGAREVAAMDSRITTEMRLMFAIGAMLLAVVAEQVVLLNNSLWPFAFITHVLFLIAVVHCVVAVILQWNELELQSTSVRPVFISASCASFLLGIGAVLVLFASPGQSISILIGFGIIIAAVALLGLLFFLPEETSERAQNRAVQDTIPPEQYEVSVMEEPERVELPPLFSDDPLYSLPQPRDARLFVQAKSNDLLVNCEDACAISPDETHFALCDGTSSSSLPRSWATLLARQWVNEPLLTVNEHTLTQWLDGPRASWQQWVNQTWLPAINQRNRATGLPPLPAERVQDVMKSGAYSTFLGLLLDRQAGEWWAMAIGDTCLFQFRQNETGWACKRCFPLQAASEFSDVAYTFNSHMEGNVRPLLSHIKIIRSTCRRGDLLVMATDALAKWLFTQLEQNASEWQHLLGVTDANDFVQFVDWSRSQGTLSDDDTTLILIPV